MRVVGRLVVHTDEVGAEHGEFGFLVDLTHDRVECGFARLATSTREFPVSGTVGVVDEEDLSVGVRDDRGGAQTALRLLHRCHIRPVGYTASRSPCGLHADGTAATIGWLSPGSLVTIRPMAIEDIPTVEDWLREPHVARWWTPETTAARETEKFRARVEGAPRAATKMRMVQLNGRPVGWCQWYRWADYPSDAAATGAADDEIGADYAIGDPHSIGRGVGTAMVAALVGEIRRHHEGKGIVIAPEAHNAASRRVLEKNGFQLVGVHPIATEPHDRPMAIYRLAPRAPS